MHRVRELGGIKTSGIRGPLAHLWKMEAGSSACTHTQEPRPVERGRSPGGSGSADFSASSGVCASPPYPLGSPVSSAWTVGLLSIAPFLSFSPSLASLAGHLPQGVTWTSCLPSLHLMSRPTPRLTPHLPRPSPVPSLLASLSAFASISISSQPGLLHSSCFIPCTCPPTTLSSYTGVLKTTSLNSPSTFKMFNVLPTFFFLIRDFT